MKETLEALGTVDKYTELFYGNRDQIGQYDPAFLSDLREKAIRSFQETGFPLKKNENYRYTHLEPVFGGEMSFHFQPREISFDERELFRCDVPMLDSQVLMVLDGFFYSTRDTSLYEPGNGIIYGSLQEAMRRYPDLVGRYLGKNASLKEEP
ncbi:MAG: hypothetical protein EHM46_05875, partial [Bacteroidetes bacterium]